MKKKKRLFSTIVGIIIFCYVVVNSNILGDIKASVKEISKNATLVKEELQKETNVVMNQTMDIHFIDVGQADAILIRNGDKNMLIDAGNNEDGQMLVDYFQKLGIKEFEHVFATHAHEDHIGGMDDIVNNFSIDNFYMPDALTTTKTFVDLLDSLMDKGMKYETPKIGDEIIFADSKIEVLSVLNSEELNDTSIVLKLTYGKNCFLFTGDATNKVEKSILDKGLKCDVLKVAHHGSSLSNSQAFLEKVNPEYAVISVGKDNSYKHPHDEVLKRLNNLNIKIYRTDETGTIIISSDGKDIKVLTDEKKVEE